MGRQSMLHHINKILRLLTDDGREMTGKLLVFDRHMNVVLSNVTEKRPTTKKMEKEGVDPVRQLGLILLRGEHVVSVTVVGEDEEGKKRIMKEGEEEHSRNTNEEGEDGLDFRNAPKLKRAMTAKRQREE